MFCHLFFILASNPFIDAYFQSDLLGKLIFIGLLGLSIISWILIIDKFLLIERAKKNAAKFYKEIQSQKKSLKLGILHFEPSFAPDKKTNPFYYLYQLLKKQTIDLLNKNKNFNRNEERREQLFLSATDISFLESQMRASIVKEINGLEKNLYLLSIVISLAPFLGLLGTVWGILITFSELQGGAGNSHQMLGGLSLALATTVVGLIDAIPALIGYNYFKNKIADFEIEMEGFSTEIISSVEMSYRQVDVLNG